MFPKCNPDSLSSCQLTSVVDPDPIDTFILVGGIRIQVGRNDQQNMKIGINAVLRIRDRVPF